jgi:tight adherence protein C
MSPAVLFGFFLFVVAAISVAGYVFVLRDARPDLQAGGAISLQKPELPRAQAAVAGALESLGEALPLPGDKDELRRQLMAAGYRWPSSVAIFQGIKAAAALMFGIAGAWAAMAGRPEAGPAVLAAVCGLGFGYMIPDRILDRMAAARALKLRRALPAALDLMVLGIEAGQALDAAIGDTSRGLRITYPELASEFTQLQLEMRATTSRSEALRNFAARSRDAEIRKFANLLVETDRFGTSLGPALKTHARYLRIRFRQSAQERARKVGVKLIFPVFFLIFPSVILVTLGPAVILLASQMKHLLGP